MIIRIVKMQFIPDAVVTFQATFAQNKNIIRNFEGCHHVELWQDVQESSRFFTYSHWESEAALNRYRQSTFFQKTWKSIKPLFAVRPEAWSVAVKDKGEA